MRKSWFVLIISIVAIMCLANVVLAQTTTPKPLPVVVEGTVTAITVTDAHNGKITVTPAVLSDNVQKPPVTFIVNATTKVYKDNKLVGLGDVNVGDDCRAMLVKTDSGNLVAQLVYAKTVVPPTLWAKGTIAKKELLNGVRTFSLDIPGIGASPDVLMLFSVTDATKITVDGKVAKYDQLAVGQIAEVAYLKQPPVLTPGVLPIPALVVTAKTPPPPVFHIIGRLAGVDVTNGVIGVQPAVGGVISNVIVNLKVTDATKIDKFGPVKIGDLRIGDSVDVVGQGNQSSTTMPPIAISVTVLPESFAGKVVDVITSNATGTAGTLVIQQAVTNGSVTVAVPFKVLEKTRVTKNGILVPLAKIEKGNTANVKYFKFGDTNVASLVEARSPIPIMPPLTIVR